MGEFTKSLSLCALLLLTLRIAQHHRRLTAHNPLELWATHNVRVALAENGGASIRCNATVLEGQHQWVEVTWSGLGTGGAHRDGAARCRCCRLLEPPPQFLLATLPQPAPILHPNTLPPRLYLQAATTITLPSSPPPATLSSQPPSSTTGRRARPHT